MTRYFAIFAFVAFASAYFLSNVVRAITATIAPQLTQEFALNSGELGLLAGGYFAGFALMQLPMGAWLDRFGSKRVLMTFLLLAVLGSATFAWSGGFWGLWLSRMTIGMGVSACLMAPMTAYRLWFSPANQLRAGAWMMMIGASGMLASTLPVHHLLPILGWRGVFISLALIFMAVIAFILWVVPDTRKVATPATPANTPPLALQLGYKHIAQNRYFIRIAPLGFLFYGGYSAMQTLWMGPWLVNMVGLDAAQAAQGLLMINLCVLLTFLFWGAVMPHLSRLGLSAETLIACILPLPLAVIALISWWPQQAQWWVWALYLVLASPLSLAQPVMAQQFPQHLAGRALSLFNLTVFSGSFATQWLFGLLIDHFFAMTGDRVLAWQSAMGVFMALCLAAYIWFVVGLARQRLARAIAIATPN